MQMDSVRFTMLTLHDFLAWFMLQMKSALKDLLMQAEERASQNMVLEALAAGSQEEVKVDRWDSMLSLLPRPSRMTGSYGKLKVIWHHSCTQKAASAVGLLVKNVFLQFWPFFLTWSGLFTLMVEMSKLLALELRWVFALQWHGGITR
jgi:hypothetical protein